MSAATDQRPRVARLALPRLTRQQAQRDGLIAAASGTVSVRFGPHALPVRIASPGGSSPFSHEIRLALGDHPLSLHVTWDAVRLLVSLLDPKIVVDQDMDLTLLDLLLDTLLHWHAPAWQDAVGQALRFTSLDSSSAVPDGSLHLLAGGPRNEFAIAISGEPAIEVLLHRWPTLPRPTPPLTWSATFGLGHTELPAEIVASLRIGDAVVVQCHRPNDMPLQLEGGWVAATRRRGDGVMLLERPAPPSIPRYEGIMDTPDLGNMAALPVRLEFGVGRRDLTLAEVQALQPGVVLGLDKPAVDLVEISANGRRIGTGELVEVDGVVAVRITKLLSLA